MNNAIIFKSLFLFFSILILVSCEKNTSNNNQINTIEDLLVKSNEITGWTYSGGGWTVYSIPELTEKIDGEAEIYNRYNFVEAANKEYQGTVNNELNTINLTIIKLSTNSNAQDLYSDPDIILPGAQDWQSGAGEKGNYVRNSLSQTITFYRKNFFVKIFIVTDTDESLNVIKQFALNVDNKIK